MSSDHFVVVKLIVLAVVNAFPAISITAPAGMVTVYLVFLDRSEIGVMLSTLPFTVTVIDTALFAFFSAMLP